MQDISRACQNFLCGNRAGVRRMRRAGATLSPELRYASSSHCRSDALKEPLVRCRGLCNIEDMCGYPVQKERACKRREEGDIQGCSDPQSKGTMSRPVYTRELEQSTWRYDTSRRVNPCLRFNAIAVVLKTGTTRNGSKSPERCLRGVTQEAEVLTPCFACHQHIECFTVSVPITSVLYVLLG